MEVANNIIKINYITMSKKYIKIIYQEGAGINYYALITISLI